MVLVPQPVEGGGTLGELPLDLPPGGDTFGLRSSYEKKSKINLVPVEGAARELAVPLHPETAAVVAGHQPVRGVAGRHRPVAAWCRKLFRTSMSRILDHCLELSITLDLCSLSKIKINV